MSQGEPVIYSGSGALPERTEIIRFGYLISTTDDVGTIGQLPDGVNRRPNSIQIGTGNSRITGTLTTIPDSAAAVVTTEAQLYGITSGGIGVSALRAGGVALVAGIRVNGTVAVPTALALDDEIVRLNSRGYDGTAIGAGANIGLFAEQAWAVGAHGCRIDFRVVANGATAQTLAWRMNNAGHLLTPTDNTFDIGASGATRPRSIFVGTRVTTPDLTITNMGGGTGVVSVNAVDTAGVGFRALRVPN